MKRINRRQFLFSSAAFLSATMPCHAFWPFSDKVSAPSSPADIRGKVFKGDAPDKLWNGLIRGFCIKNSETIRWYVGSALYG